jgi:carboxypeptidase PM20D1
MDDKGSLMACMEAVESLLAEGFAPARTLYLGLGHDEETGGRGAAAMARLLRERNVRLLAVLDEGMAVTNGMVPGIAVPVALIGIAEKGYLSVEILAESAGGHSSIPPPRGAAGILSAAVNRVVEHPFPATLRGPTRDMFRFLAPEMSWPLRTVFSNLWLFGPLVRAKLAADPPTNAAIRTTAAVTILEAGVTENVLPARARAVVNLRLLPGDTVNGVLARLERELGDLPVTVHAREGGRDPSPVSSPGSPAFRALARSIGEVFPGAVVAPGLVLGGTDSRHFTGLADDVYRFVPLWMEDADVSRIHGIDERISVDRHADAVRFYRRLIANWIR